MMMDFLFLSVLLLGLEPVIGNTTDTVDQNQSMLINRTNQLLQSIPFNSNVSMVTKLVLNRNHISLNEGDVKALSSYHDLEELYLENNLIYDVPTHLFTRNPSLRVLSLKKNKIKRLLPQVFDGVERLTSLDLSHNNLTCLPAELNEAFNDLQMLELRGNPWNCSCPSVQMFDELKLLCVSPSSSSSSSLIFISQPPGLNRSITEDETPERSSKTWTFTASVLVLALTTSLIVVTAIKGPSWYKVFHNYRHRRLHGDQENTLPQRAQTFRFNDGREEEEEEEGYYEDPYIQSLG